MSDLIKILESFNRKERYFLIAQALGKPTFELAPGFREELRKKIGVCVPEDAFVAMDYHLDWLAASLTLYDAQVCDDYILCNPSEVIADRDYKWFQGTQEDIDLLVAFGPDSENTYHLIVLEAKAYGDNGFAAFDRSQLSNKGKRLVMILGDHGKTVQKHNDIKITPYFYLVSQKEPQPQTAYDHPWSKDRWIQLDLPPLNERRIVERFDKQREKASMEGDYLRIKKLR